MKIFALLHRFRRNQRGYTLVVMAALFAAFAVAVSIYIDRNLAAQVMDRQKNDHDRMTRLSNALVQFAAFNAGRYPCPASPLIVPSNASFGAPITNCYTGLLPSGVVQLENTGDIIRGMVPVRALAPYGIDVKDAFDNWNARIMYVVNRQTTPGGSGTISVRPTVIQQPFNITMNRPSFVLISYGRDHLGGYMRGQSSTSLTDGPAAPCAVNSIKRREENCDSDASFILAPSLGGNDVSLTNYFDDVVTVYSEGIRKCLATTVNWYACSAPMTEQEHGFTQSLSSTNGISGSVTVTCNDGQYVRTNENCSEDSSSGGHCANYQKTLFQNDMAGPNTGCYSIDLNECGAYIYPNWTFRHAGNCSCSEGTSQSAC